MKYTESHEWVKLNGEIATVGVSDYAQKELGEIVYVELPQEGHSIKEGEEVVVLESTKAAIDIYTPVSGVIKEVNNLLKQYPEKVNTSAETDGWLFKIKINNADELNSLMDENNYKNYIKNL